MEKMEKIRFSKILFKPLYVYFYWKLFSICILEQKHEFQNKTSFLCEIILIQNKAFCDFLIFKAFISSENDGSLPLD